MPYLGVLDDEIIDDERVACCPSTEAHFREIGGVTELSGELCVRIRQRKDLQL
jgi:hypothetical protein